MRKIVYYVAVSLDGYICGQNNDISAFVSGGDGIQKYFSDLSGFDTVIMGRNTYEFGFAFGLQPGQPAYPNMQHYIFSSTASYPNMHETVHICEPSIDEINKIKQQEGTSIYLCGGGIFSGWLLDHDLVDEVWIKLNPIILGTGTRLFGNSKKSAKLNLSETHAYEEGLQIMRFTVKKPIESR